jgi:Lon protease-like protein
VLFPGGRLPLRIFEQRYMEMAKACLKDGSPFGVCLIREGREVGDPATPNSVGTLAKIGAWDMPQLGLLQITANGGPRFRILERRVQKDGLARARVELLAEETDQPVPQPLAVCVKLLERVIEQHPELFERPHRLDSCAWVSARLGEILPLDAKQALLELDNTLTRLERIAAAVAAS